MKADPQPAVTRLQVVQYVEREMELAGFALSPSLCLFRGCSVAFIHIVRFRSSNVFSFILLEPYHA